MFVCLCVRITVFYTHGLRLSKHSERIQASIVLCEKIFQITMKSGDFPLSLVPHLDSIRFEFIEPPEVAGMSAVEVVQQLEWTPEERGVVREAVQDGIIYMLCRKLRWIHYAVSVKHNT